MINKLLIGTHSESKKSEYQQILKKFNLKIISLTDLKIKRRIRETGKSYEKNAILKARGYAKISGLLTLSDDGGLEINALNGWPGYRSRRITGKISTDQELIDCTLEKMRNLPRSKRKASLKAILCLAWPNGKYYLSVAKINGLIANHATRKRLRGYPFRSIFWIPCFKKYFINLNHREWNIISHRKKAIKKFIPILKKYARH